MEGGEQGDDSRDYSALAKLKLTQDDVFGEAEEETHKRVTSAPRRLPNEKRKVGREEGKLG